ncbi:anion permease [Aliirhizobium terrae]|uniref:anion permease n=1 Tax=Terrirhizobium terrae TaxID=2926709 RepID=UPI002578B13F|nr:anion permease [Rhizobium sp. CC-CFT758]WJH40797.1 anion permease [Rhizobium sp. CC-CFT758]
MKDMISHAELGWEMTAAVLVLIFTFAHYMFASTTAHVSAMMLAFLSVGVLLIPVEYQPLFVLMMVAASAIMMTLTHYATGTSPIIFGSGYVTMGKWWGVGLVMCLVNLAIFTVVGATWWRVLGYW